MISMDVSTLFKSLSGLLSAAICESPLFTIFPFFECTNTSSHRLTLKSSITNVQEAGVGLLEVRIASNDTESIISISKSAASEFILFVLSHVCVCVWLTPLCIDCD